MRPIHRMLRQFLYLSHMTPQADYRHLSDITQQATALNRRHGIHAALLFDGFRFCQRVLGPAEPVSALLQRLHKDPRHSGLRLLADREMDAADAGWPAGSNPWVSGYCDPVAFDVFDSATAPQGTLALTFFDRMLAQADLRP